MGASSRLKWGLPGGGRLVLLETEPPQQQPFLVVAEGTGPVPSAEVMLDPNQPDPVGHIAIPACATT